MKIRLSMCLLLLLCLTLGISQAQNDNAPTLNIGDPAPPLRVREWLKGTPVKKFEKGKVYVVEFWATWCAPCKAAMPHLSDLAHQYKDQVTFIGMDIMETRTTSMTKIKAFVDSMGDRMDYHVAAMDSNRMAATWMYASGEYGIPRSFVVNAAGKVAWIGYPMGLDEVLPEIVNDTWNIKAALAKRNFEKHLEKLDSKVYEAVGRFVADPHREGLIGNPDSALLVLTEMVRKEPGIKYAPGIAYHTFASLLKTNLDEAYNYGKKVLVTSTYEEPACYAIIDPIKLYSDRLDLPAKIYQLGAEAYRVRISQIPFPELVNLPKLYSNMPEWYWRANDKSNAIIAQQAGIQTLKSKKEYEAMKIKKTVVPAEIALFELHLRHYKNK